VILHMVELPPNQISLYFLQFLHVELFLSFLFE
jgi:hypothetical protein